MREIEFIVIHCADTPANMDIGADEIREWHTAPKPGGNGWADIGYAYVIRRSGAVEKGRDIDNDGDVEDEIGAHVRGYNKESIGVCVVGGKPGCNFTRMQWRALELLIGDLTDRYPDAKVVGHRNLDARKQCPTFDAVAWWYG